MFLKTTFWSCFSLLLKWLHIIFENLLRPFKTLWIFPASSFPALSPPLIRTPSHVLPEPALNTSSSPSQFTLLWKHFPASDLNPICPSRTSQLLAFQKPSGPSLFLSISATSFPPHYHSRHSGALAGPFMSQLFPPFARLRTSGFFTREVL